MTTAVQIHIECQVDECEEGVTFSDEQKQAAAVEAIENAVRFGESNGFSHTHAADLAIGIVDVSASNEALDLLEDLLAWTSHYTSQFSPPAYTAWKRISARCADLRDGDEV